MKALLINGSPRPHGCTYTALTELKRALEAEGIEVELIHVGNKDIRGCIACRKCHETGKCVFDDIVNEVAPKLAEADAFVIGAPVYFSSPAGGAISFMDLRVGVGDRAVAFDRPVPPVGHRHTPVVEVAAAILCRRAEVRGDGLGRAFPAYTGGFNLDAESLVFHGVRSFRCVVFRFPAGLFARPARRDTFITPGRRKSNPTKATRFRGQISSESTKPAPRRKALPYIAKTGLFARAAAVLPTCGP